MILYAITDRSRMGPDAVVRAQALTAAGVDWLQVREKDLQDAPLFGILSRLADSARGCRILVNGRPDLALASGCAGVHLPSSGLPTHRVRALCPPPLLLVRSCHSAEEARRAQGEGADAVTAGPVFPTPSKDGMGPPLGLRGLAEVCEGLEIPVLALGGIGPCEVRTAMEAGAAGIAGIRLFWEMEDPAAQVAALRRSAALA